MLKKLGQVFTPEYIVNQILKEVGYLEENMLNKKILEPSFGNGAFLKIIIEKLIVYCLCNNISKSEINNQLLNIYGIEIDKKLYEETIYELNFITAKYGLNKVSWNLFNEDSTSFETNIKFDFIVGNPPYIRIHDLDSNMREHLKKFTFSNGMMDIYIIFFELGIKLLNETGKLGFITPNSFIKNTSQKNFRDYLCNSGMVQKIINYNFTKIFNNANTYTAITILNKEKNDNLFFYIESNGLKEIFTSAIDLSQYKDKERWAFGKNEDNLFLEKNNKLKDKLGNICNIQYGICTNKDEVYISEYIQKTKLIGTFNGFDIEKAILRPVIKGSTYSGKVTRMILFPYVWNKTKKTYDPITELILKNKYPMAYKYLLHNKGVLEQRDMDKNAITWYQFARSQGLSNINNSKILINHIFNAENDSIKTYKILKNVIIYAGIYITSSTIKENNKIIKILKSKSFCKYSKLVGKDMSGGYKCISTKNIKSFGIE